MNTNIASQMSMDGLLEKPQLSKRIRKQFSIYVYVEMLEPRDGKKPNKKAVRIGQITKQYSVDNYDNTSNRALEEAVDVACGQLYKLKEKRVLFSRVFVSKLADAKAAQKDPCAFSYSWRN